MKKPEFNFGLGMCTVILVSINITIFLITAGYIETDVIPTGGCIKYDSDTYSCYVNQAGSGYFLCSNEINPEEIKDPMEECKYITKICCVGNTSGIMQGYALMPIRVSSKPHTLLFAAIIIYSAGFVFYLPIIFASFSIFILTWAIISVLRYRNDINKISLHKVITQ